MKTKLLPLLVVLAGCSDPVVQQSVVETYEAEEVVSCRHAGYCYTMAPGFNGSMKPKWKFSPACPGSQEARVLIEVVQQTHESGKVSVINHRTTIETLGECE